MLPDSHGSLGGVGGKVLDDHRVIPARAIQGSQELPAPLNEAPRPIPS